MENIAPGLLLRIRTSFRSRISEDSDIQALYRKIADGGATYADALDYAARVGQALSDAFGDNLAAGSLPDGKMYFNIADRVIRPMLEEDHGIVSDAALTVQQHLNQQAGISIKPQKAPLNHDRIGGIVDKVSSEDFELVRWVLAEPVVNYSMSVVDETVQANADFHYKVGLTPKIIRKSEPGACKWCRNLAGEFDYPDVPKDVYRRHENCRCRVEYDPGGSKRRQNVHTKQWTTDEETDKIKTRKTFGLLTEQNRRYEPDIDIGKSVGAKAKDQMVTLPNGEKVGLAQGSRITHIQTIAGLGRAREIDEIDILVDRFPDSEATLWKKKKGIGVVDYHGENYRAELHWYEEPTVGRVKMKVKPDADGNWFFEDE